MIQGSTETDLTLDQLFNYHCKNPSDIGSHLILLQYYATQCNHITEFGVRHGVSTTAFMYGLKNSFKEGPKKLVCYDWNRQQEVDVLQRIANDNDIEFVYLNLDTRYANIESTDFLFIDSWHTGEQLRKELWNNHHQVKKYICFHDTYVYRYYGNGKDGNSADVMEEGLWKPIMDFIKEQYKEGYNWDMIYHSDESNGLTIIERMK